MKKIISILAIVTTLWSCQAQENEFSKESLQSVLKDKNNEDITFEQIIKNNKGKTVFIEVWASWCPDCVKALPEVEKLHNQFGNSVEFVNLSCDKTYEKWLVGIEKFNVQGDNYLITDGMKGTFGSSIKVDWIPRYMIVDKNGKIVLFRAIEKDFDKIKETLTNLK